MKAWIQRKLSSAGFYLFRDVDLRRDIERIESKVIEIDENSGGIRGATESLLQIALQEETRGLLSEIRAHSPENVVLHGRKVFSQCDEDGIISSIFAKIGGANTFIEIGCGNGLENNTCWLLLQGWKGVWVDGSEDLVGAIGAKLGGLQFPRLMIEQQFIDRENIRELVCRYCEFSGSREVDFFSLDIDGNELPVLLRAREVCNPRLLCVEYNAKFPPPINLGIRYAPAHRWRNDDYQGYSLMALVSGLADRYTLLTCTLSGVNAFFVRNDLAHQFKIYPVEDVYQPARYHRLKLVSGHPASLRWLKDALAGDHQQLEGHPSAAQGDEAVPGSARVRSDSVAL